MSIISGEFICNSFNTFYELIGVEPSAILTFLDEYVDLADYSLFEIAKELSKKVFTINKFIAREIDKENITAQQL